jgi:glutathione S-transferase
MADMKLVIADKNYCLWPLPAWLCLRTAELEFDEVLIRFGDQDRREQMLGYGPTGRVPVLHHDDLVIWDSMAICEYVADLVPDAGLWPKDINVRAIARAFAAEMHATGGAYPGAVRHIIFSLDTNVRRRTDPVTPEPKVQDAIDHLSATWGRLRAEYGQGGPFLFGKFSIADAMSAHLVNRLTTYVITVPPEISAYMDAVRGFPAMAEWIAAAEAEDWALPSAEIDVSARTTR